MSIAIKIKTFNIYVRSVFLYNSELWTLTEKLEESINVFQRRSLKKILGVYWPRKITNTEIYKRTKSIEWSKVVKRRRLSWLGHLLRLPVDTPARKALQEYIRPVKKKVGRPKTTWFRQIYDDLKGNVVNVNFKDEYTMIKDLDIICKNRTVWNKIIRSIMLDEPTSMQ